MVISSHDGSPFKLKKTIVVTYKTDVGFYVYNLFLSNVSILYLLKTWDSQLFSFAFFCYKFGILIRNVLINYELTTDN